MAKQKGLAKFAGKIDDQSFYYSKNGGYMSRKINPGMSARVKTAAEYANTRLNNAEFGGAGACAGAIVRGISQRWRFILSPIATGMLVKAIKKEMMKDTTSPWGRRKVAAADMPAIQDVFNGMSKNNVPAGVVDFVKNQVKYDATNNMVFASDGGQLTADEVAELKAKGADGVNVSYYAYNVDAPTPDADGNSYEIATNRIQHLSGLDDGGDLVIGSQLVIGAADGQVTSFGTISSATAIAGVLAIVMPYKNVGAKQYVLQELCSACWIESQAGTSD